MASLTDMRIRAIEPPAKGQKTYFDDALQGFGVRVSQGGTKTFIVIYGNERRRITIGTWPVVPLAKARERAKDKLAEIQLGGGHAPIPFKKLKQRFLEDIKGDVRPRTYDSYSWLLGRLEIAGDANTITLRTLTEKTSNMAPSVQQHVLAVVKIMFRWGVGKGYLKSNPTDALKVKKAKGRKRFLDPDEIRQVWRATPDNPFGTTVKLLLLTGQRRNEIQHFRLKEDLVTIPGEFVKNHRDHTFPVAGATKKLIALDRSWGGWSRSKQLLDQAINDERDNEIPPWTLHDLRRTFRTTWASLKLPREVAEKYINHVSGVQSPVEQIYDQHSYIPEMRECIKVYTAHILQLVA